MLWLACTGAPLTPFRCDSFSRRTFSPCFFTSCGEGEDSLTLACVFGRPRAPLLLTSRALLMLMALFSGIAEEGPDGPREPLHPSLLPLGPVRMVPDNLLEPW